MPWAMDTVVHKLQSLLSKSSHSSRRGIQESSLPYIVVNDIVSVKYGGDMETHTGEARNPVLWSRGKLPGEK